MLAAAQDATERYGSSCTGSRFLNGTLELHEELERRLAAFMKMEKKQGPNEITRYNLYNSAAIRGNPARGYTTGDAIDAVKEVAEEVLPRGYDVAWEGLSFDEERRGNEALVIFGIVLTFVYLVLAAQYESFILPFAVILSLPAGIFGSFALLLTLGLANDIYAQVGLVMLVGLLGKNAVLIVEFAQQELERGASLYDATIAGARARFRPILMTALATMMGILPIALGRGAGGDARAPLGIAVVGGVFFSTLLTFFIVPATYVLLGRAMDSLRPRERAGREAASPASAGGA